MAWVSVHQQLRDHRKLRDLFRRLKTTRQEALGYLILIWLWSLDNADPKGLLLSTTVEDIEEAGYWNGEPRRLYQALVDSGWIDEHEDGIYLHDWEDFNKPFYQYIDRKSKDKLRKQNKNSAGNSTEIPQEFHDSPSPSPSPSPDLKDSKKTIAQRFSQFWEVYPKKRSKGQAEKAWNKLKPDEQLHNRIIQSLEQAKTSADWVKEDGKYIPYPATWLNTKGWEDEFKPPDPPKGGKVFGKRYSEKDDTDYETLLGIK